LVLHVGLVLAAFAGFTLAAALSGFYLWQERRLKRRETSILRVRAPGLARLDELSARTIAVALPALTLGIVVGIVRLRERGGGVDALMVVTLLTWCVYGGYVVLRFGGGLRGRRAAYVVLLGFLLVAVARLALPVTHFSWEWFSSASRITARPSSCASGRRSTASSRRRWHERSRAEAARPSASRPATGPSCTWQGKTPTRPSRASCPARYSSVRL